MKKFFAFLFTIILSMNFLVSCGMSESLEIASVTAVYDEETGDTTITIRYLDDVEAPLVFVIPQGAQGDVGQAGNGIDRIEPKDGETPGTTDLVIYFTDGREPYTVTVLNGKDGVSVTNLKIVNENPEGHPEGSKEVVFVDQYDNPIGEPFVIPAGEDGSEIADIIGETQEDGSVKVTVSYTGGGEKEFSIPGAKGILNVTSDIVGNEYLIIVEYNDGSEPTTLRFNRPTAWWSGLGEPSSDMGIVGDFYFDTSLKKIYKKITDFDWELVADLTIVRDEYTVSFTIDANMSFSGNTNEFTIEEGESFLSSGFDVPTAEKAGYKFIGWYTKRTPTPVHGAFTDLTAVTCNLVLYACWEPISE